MINNLEGKNKADLIEIINIQIEEYQKLVSENAKIKKERGKAFLFAHELISGTFEGCTFDGNEIQEIAIEHELVKVVKFDPDIHDDPQGESEKGDDWCEFDKILLVTVNKVRNKAKGR